MSCVVGVWLVELLSSIIMYRKVPRLIVKKTNRLTQAVSRLFSKALSVRSVVV